MANTVSWSGAQSAVINSSGEDFGTIPAATWDGLANGQLKNVLTATYGAGDPFVGDLSLFAAAVEKYGITVNCLISAPPSEVTPGGALRSLWAAPAENGEYFNWSLDEAGKPRLFVSADSYDRTASLIVRIQSRYSASE